MTMSADKNSPRRLIMRLGHLGDVVLVSGIIRYFGQRWNCQFDILTREQWAPLFLHHPHAGKVMAARKEDLQGAALIRYLKQIANSYSDNDILYDLHGVLRSRLLAGFWPGKVRRYQKLGLERRFFMVSGGRIGGKRLRASSVPQRYATAFCEEACSFGNAGCSSGNEKYFGQRTALLPDHDILPRLYLAEEERNLAAQRINTVCMNTLFPDTKGHKEIVAIHPFATHQNKSWPEQRWKTLTAQFDAKGIPWIVIGAAPEEQARAWSCKNSFVNQTSLRETMALLARSQVLVTGDSGPLHLARAVKTSVVALFGPTIKEWGFFPTPEEGIVLETDKSCRPCSLHGAKPCPHDGICLRDISPDKVSEAVLSLLSPSSSRA